MKTEAEIRDALDRLALEASRLRGAGQLTQERAHSLAQMVGSLLWVLGENQHMGTMLARLPGPPPSSSPGSGSSAGT